MALCYLDQAFCSTDCVNHSCRRNFSPVHQAKAKEWWKGMRGSPPICFSDFMCKDYLPPDSPVDDWSKHALPS